MPPAPGLDELYPPTEDELRRRAAGAAKQKQLLAENKARVARALERQDLPVAPAAAAWDEAEAVGRALDLLGDGKVCNFSA